MLFTRTIRRKLLLVLALVLTMLCTLSISGISGLNSYRTVIRNLEHEFDTAPQLAELEDSIARLFKSFVTPEGKPAVFRSSKFTQQLAEVRKQWLVFHDRFSLLPPSPLRLSQETVTQAKLQELDDKLTEIERDVDSLSDKKLRGRPPAGLQDRVCTLLVLASDVPDPVMGMSHMLHEARTDYKTSLIIVWTTSAIVLLLFLGLVRYGYIWIFYPIRELHQGALRVAQGDFNYRVKISTYDEMSELADAFNKMTCRFQEIAADLDRQVNERSQQLVRSERLAGVGFLAAGVAHEINNPLSAIAMASESVEGRLSGVLSTIDPGEADVIRHYLQMSQNEAFRCKQITERLLDFSRGRDSVREQTDVTRLTAEVVAMVQYLSKYREKKIEFSRATPAYAEINGPEIKQVLRNLVANGLDAMERGGTLHLEITEQTDHVVILVRDEGCGMTREVIEHMFEPFFTSKQPGQGTGLGLSISHRIISQHGGTISATSDGPGSGSTFSVRLPRHSEFKGAAA